MQWKFGRCDGSEFLQAPGLIGPLAGQTFPSDPAIWWCSVGRQAGPQHHICADNGRRGAAAGLAACAARGGVAAAPGHTSVPVPAQCRAPLAKTVVAVLAPRRTPARHWPRLWEREGRQPVGTERGSQETGSSRREILSPASEISSVKSFEKGFSDDRFAIATARLKV